MDQRPVGDAEAAAVGCLLGTAVGDALGLPREGLSASRAKRLFGGEVGHCLLPGRGMVSDDTDHAVMTASALFTAGGSPEAFARNLAWRLRWWFLALPAGVGLATAKACLRLWVGAGPDRSGVPSAGNGPMMRAPIIGVLFAAELERMRAFVRACTRLTHTDPRAERAAFVVALIASHALRHPGEPLDGDATVAEILRLVPDADDELREILKRAVDPTPLTDLWPKGPSGYAYHTLLAVLHTLFRHPQDFAYALRDVILLGGDTDTTGAILGGVAGAILGPSAVPDAWVRGVVEWPRSMTWVRELGRRLSLSSTAKGAVRPPRYFVPGVLPRNLFFLAVVVGHGFYRLVRTGAGR